MRFLFIALFQLLLLQNSFSQADSSTFMNADWSEKKIASGIELRQCRFDHSLFGASQNISILEIKLSKKNHLDVEAEPKKLQGTSAFGETHDALAAINGNFFDMKNGGSEDYIRIDGKVFNEARPGKNNARIFHQKAAIVISDRKVDISQWDGSADWESRLPGEDIIETGPLLIYGHSRVQLDSNSFNNNRHPRTALAIKGNKVFLVAIDGRNPKAAGMTLIELSNILSWLDADKAVNLDGGGSTTMWINHYPGGGVVNYPSDNKKMEKSASYKPGTDLDNLAADEQKWDHTGERPVANVILVNKKK